MKIRMLKNERGSVDGIRVDEYLADTEYDLSATDGERELAQAFVGAELAEEVGKNSIPAEDEKLAELPMPQKAAKPRKEPK